MFIVEQRGTTSRRQRTKTLVVSIAIGLVVGSLPILLAAANPLAAYRETIESSVGSARAMQETLRASTPLILTGLAAAVAFRLRLYTIGAEGQLYIGAITACGMALALGDGHSAWLVVPATLLAGAVGGALWSAIVALPRAYFGTDEVVGTLMLNLIALQVMNWLIFGSVSYWRDRANLGFPGGKPIPESARFHQFWGRADIGVVVAVGCAAALSVVLRRTAVGYEWRVIGSSERAAAYAGMNVRRQIVAVLVVSGAFAGIAGATQIESVTYALEPRAIEAGGLGFTGIVVAVVAGLNPGAVVLAAFVIAGITSSGPSLSSIGISASSVIVMQGVLLLSVAGGQFFNNFTVRRRQPALEVTQSHEAA
jgi:simple sugar transport system permease protein